MVAQLQVYHLVYNIIIGENISICPRLSHGYELVYAVIYQRVNKSVFFKNLPLSFSFAESTIFRLKLNCKTFFAVILNGICLLALNIRVNTLRKLKLQL